MGADESEKDAELERDAMKIQEVCGYQQGLTESQSTAKDND